MPGAALPPAWRLVALPRVTPGEASLVADAGTTVLRLRASAAVASVSHALDVDAGARPQLAWRWKVDRVVAAADLARKEGDDFAARLYVTFDIPLEALPFATRTRIRMGRLLFGSELPAAALCYVWDNRHPVGTTAWNPYSDRVRMVVLRSGGARAGEWMAESRDVVRDYRAAFGEGVVPRVSGIVVSVDTDQTGEDATAWFGDIAFGPRA
jgi:hypothetical protein